MRALPLLTIAAVSLPAVGVGIVIDDFTVGAITVATSGERFDEILEEQNGLPTAAVPFGRRVFMAQQVDDPVTLSVDTQQGGSFTYATADRSGINTYLLYGSANGVDGAANGENALVFEFESTSFTNPQLPDFPNSGFVDLSLQSTNGGAYQYVRLPSSDEPFTLAIPFSLLGTLDPSDITRLELGTGNGNLDGTFTLASITTEQLAPTDYNGDGSIDAADYTVWRDTMARGFYQYQGDGNTDGSVNQGDLFAWQAAYGGGDTLALPEPTSLVISFFLFVSASSCRSPRRILPVTR